MAYPETRTQSIHKSLPYGTLADLKVWFADLEGLSLSIRLTKM